MDQQSDSHHDEEGHPVYAQARHHTYLPGAIHPISSIDATAAPHNRLELAVLEWPDSVVFPGMVIPVRFSDPEWIAYLQNQILQNAATASQQHHPVRFGLLMGERRDNRPQPQRRSWARQGQGPTALRRLSQQLIQELADAMEAENNDETSALFDPVVMVSRPPPSARSYARQSRRSWTLLPDDDDDDDVLTNQNADPFVGRIGTIVTVLYRHGNEALFDCGPRRSSSQMIVTAVGTARFRIVGYRSRSEQDEFSRQTQRRSLKYFRIEELQDRPVQLPSLPHCPSYAMPKESCGYEAQRRHLSLVSPYPSWVLNKFWPWKILASILVALRNHPSFEGLLEESNAQPGSVFVDDSKSQPSLENVLPSQSHEPVAFSFWLAANLPFQTTEKLEILQMISVLDRLNYIYEKVQHFVLNEALISCFDCASRISSSFQMFTLDGAEGTTGHYVNEHGVIHQTITLREVNEGSVHFDSEAHVQDSWFPGYSWTIMSCAVCAHHLGWKFCSVEDTTAATTPDINPLSSSNPRPKIFYGISAANVDIYVPSQRPQWNSVYVSP